MILRIFISESEIEEFFTNKGYTVEKREFGKFMPAYHGREEWQEASEPAVVVSGKYVKAAELFEAIASVHIKSIIRCCPDEVIDSEFNKIAK